MFSSGLQKRNEKQKKTHPLAEAEVGKMANLCFCQI
jgi:hypothetical protein